ncbi:MAG: ATP-binding protein [Firmicutes bacterium]|nr:ATP-binding protein [Bacillota bacterium]
MSKQILKPKLEKLPTPYSHNLEYLADQLKRLDILIQLALYDFQNQPQLPGPLEQLKGLVITENEVNNILFGAQRNVADNSGINKLKEELTRIDNIICERKELSVKANIYLALPRLAHLFNLTPFEEQTIVICLAPELDRKYDKLFAYLQDDVTLKKPSIDLVLKLLCNTEEQRISARSAFYSEAPLFKYNLILIDQSPSTILATPMISRRIKLDNRITDYLLGFDWIDSRITPFVKRITFDSSIATVFSEPQPQIRQFVVGKLDQFILTGEKLFLYFYGPVGSGKKLQTISICRELQLPLLMVDLQALSSNEISFSESIEIIGREAALQQAALCFNYFQCLFEEENENRSYPEEMLRVVRTYSPLTFIIGNSFWRPEELGEKEIFIDVEFTIPDERNRQEFWKLFADDYQIQNGLDFSELAAKFRFTPGQIKNSLRVGYHTSLKRFEDGGIGNADLYTACYNQSRHNLKKLAQKIHTKYTWNDIVLPKDQMDQLHEICNQMKYRAIVYDEWGFDRKLSLGKGLNILFSGAPGTGKTMAAEVIANELSLELYKIDLSQVVSKYIGETEKNLSRVFQEAENSNAVLFFDEADALFGKRSEVKDAHDRYANIEIGYLLQKMEEYVGIVVLATNLNKNIDEAFLRRLQFVVEFPFPDLKEREEMWYKIFPESAPRSQDLDYAFLAKRLKLAGGNIKNIAVTAAFYAAKDSSAIGMRQIMTASRREFRKLGLPFVKSDFEPYYDLVGEV